MTEPNPADVLAPCPFCGKQCAQLIIDQGDKWAHYEPSCLEVRTRYNVSDDAPWIAEAIAAWNTRQPTQSDAQIIANERKAIAAWLRGEVDTDYTDPEYDIGRNLADAVERGAYIQEQSK